MKIAYVLSIGLLASSYLQAGAGGLEISQACVAEGCFAGDSEGWPIQITEGGSYFLSSNLEVLDPSITAISITAPNVALDLRGFSIKGPTQCTGEPVECVPSGNGRGISGEVVGVNVFNGQIRGFPGYIVILGKNSRVSELLVSDGLFGIAAEFGSVVNRSFVENTRFGIGVDGMVSDSTVTRTHQTAVQGATIIRNSYIGENRGIGIYLGTAALIEGNRISNNVHGIIVESLGANLIDNVIDGNSSIGIWLTDGASAALSGNSLVENAGSNDAQQTWIQGDAVLLETGLNLCGTNSSCQ